MDNENKALLEEKETGRVEAFSDGIFSIAITLLVLNLKIPPADFSGAGLWAALFEQWPVYLSFLISFINVLIMWVNHHYVFGYIRKIDGPLLFLNGFLLLTVTFFPFPTALLAEHIRGSDGAMSAAIFAGSIFLNCLSFVLLWTYTSRHKDLLRQGTPAAVIKSIRRNGLIGLPIYLLAIILAFYNVWVSVSICFLLAVFFSLTAALKK